MMFLVPLHPVARGFPRLRFAPSDSVPTAGRWGQLAGEMFLLAGSPSSSLSLCISHTQVIGTEWGWVFSLLTPLRRWAKQTDWNQDFRVGGLYKHMNTDVKMHCMNVYFSDSFRFLCYGNIFAVRDSVGHQAFGTTESSLSFARNIWKILCCLLFGI